MKNISDKGLYFEIPNNSKFLNKTHDSLKLYATKKQRKINLNNFFSNGY